MEEQQPELRRSGRKHVPSRRIIIDAELSEPTKARCPTARDREREKLESKKEEKRIMLKQCICGKTNDQIFMIYCEICKIWYHGECVGISPEDA
jgi:hypothetical protein